MAQFINVIKSIYDDVKKTTSKFADWILGHVPESYKKLISEKVEAQEQQLEDIFKEWHRHSFEIREIDSALKGFTKQFTIDCKAS